MDFGLQQAQLEDRIWTRVTWLRVWRQHHWPLPWPLGPRLGGLQPLILLLTEVWGVEAKMCWDQPLAEPQIQEACHLSSRCLWNYLPLGKLTGPRPIVFQGRPLNFWRFFNEIRFLRESLVVVIVVGRWRQFNFFKHFELHQASVCHLLRVLTFHHHRVGMNFCVTQIFTWNLFWIILSNFQFL